jgi:CRISPR/Cas system Type II protein with McrA/HNH and RuvC-like nuclease domain
MREKILQLRSEGKSYNQIQEILKCSKSTISYYCGDKQKEKTKKRTKKRRENPLKSKIDNFRYKKRKETEYKLDEERKYFNEPVRKFQKRDNTKKGKIDTTLEKTFTWQDVVDKFGVNTECYLSGEKINLNENIYHLDHILPSSRGGDNSLDNLGILHKTVNVMKNDMTPDELIDWCKKILIHNGYTIK